MTKFLRARYKICWLLLVCWFDSLNAQSTLNSAGREFRGAWIATVENIDWPSSPNLTPEAQRQEFTAYVSSLRELGFNALIVQIRPSADAFYPSPSEPWSKDLTGEQGKPPNPFYDPLQFMIQTAHQHSMEFHAWINPYRALNNNDLTSVASNHPLKQHPEWFVKYGEKYYFNPSLPEVQNHIIQVLSDLVRNYDLDAIHLDDYFYPYRIQGEEFPDVLNHSQSSMAGYDLGDWRRNNVNVLIYQLHKTIKSIKPYVQLGISPFGVWRNADKDPLRGSATKAGQTCYDDLYADVLFWMEQGWIDYVAPQLYFYLGHPLIDPEIAAQWWANNLHECNYYIGHALYRVGQDPHAAWQNPEEMPNQIKLARSMSGCQGSIYFSAKWFKDNLLGFSDSLKLEYYKRPALLPMPPKLTMTTLNKVNVIKLKNKKKFVRITWEQDLNAYYYTIHRFNGSRVGNLIDTKYLLYQSPFGNPKNYYVDYHAKHKSSYTYIITAYTREHEASLPGNPITLKKK